MRFRPLIALLLFALAGAWFATKLNACPYCTQVSLTFSQEVDSADVAVIAKLVEMPASAPDPAQNATATIKPAKFEVVDILKGEERLGKERKFEALYFGADAVGKEFLVMGMNDKANIAWATPIAIGDSGKPYLKTSRSLPKEGAERLAFFQNYLEGADELLARDAYDEFAIAPYSQIVDLKDHMQHDKLLEWIKDPKVLVSHRRLYLTMLGICGNAKDADMLEAMLKETSLNPKPGMDALVSSYLKLKGAAGLPLIEDLFLRNKDSEYTETYGAIVALRFHGQEEKSIPKERLAEALRLMLDRPQLADLVIPDLARWQDWGSMDKLVQLFKSADVQSSWVRVPVVNYLRACPLPAAKKHLDELAKIDPASVERASSFFPFGESAVAPSDKPADKKPVDKPTVPADDKAPELSGAEIPDASNFTEAEEAVSSEAANATAVKANKKESPAAVVPEAAAPAPPEAPPAETKPAAKAKESVEPKVEDSAASAPAVLSAAAKTPPSSRDEVESAGVLSAVALAGLALFLVMAAIVRGGQHVTSP